VRAFLTLVVALAMAAPLAALAGAQQYEPLSASVRSAMSRAISDKGVPQLRFKDPKTATAGCWRCPTAWRGASRMRNTASSC